MGDVVAIGADDFFSRLAHSLKVRPIGLNDLEVRCEDYDAFVCLLNQELANPLFEGCLVRGIAHFLRLTRDGEEPADVVVEDANAAPASNEQDREGHQRLFVSSIRASRLRSLKRSRKSLVV